VLYPRHGMRTNWSVRVLVTVLAVWYIGLVVVGCTGSNEPAGFGDNGSGQASVVDGFILFGGLATDVTGYVTAKYTAIGGNPVITTAIQPGYGPGAPALPQGGLIQVSPADYSYVRFQLEPGDYVFDISAVALGVLTTESLKIGKGPSEAYTIPANSYVALPIWEVQIGTDSE